MLRKNGFERYGKYTLEEVLPYIGKSNHKFWSKEHQRRLSVRMANQRMLLMGREQDCQCCGLKGEFFYLEKSGCLPPHFNLYGMDGEWPVLMTMDHIHPRSLGGKTEQSNLQLLCKHCNYAKKNDVLTLDELRERISNAKFASADGGVELLDGGEVLNSGLPIDVPVDQLCEGPVPEHVHPDA